MKYFNYLDDAQKKKLFYKNPSEFTKNSDIEMLRYCVGSLLYIPAIDKEKLYKFFDNQIKGALSVVMCLEDSVGLNGEEEAVANIKEVLEYIRNKKEAEYEIPLIFIRPRNLQQLIRFSHILIKDNLDLLTGIVIPKANGQIIIDFIKALKEMNCDSLYIMPIIETTEFICMDKKYDAFCSLNKSLQDNYEKILNLRIGVTDILGAYSLRRNKNFTIYDNMIYYRFASDILSYFGGDNNKIIVISGGVSEFYNMEKEEILESYVRELNLDKLNGFIGKTVIHPKQINVVQAMSVVTYENYMDATCILGNINSKFGVSASLYGDRMNEVNPHLNWAKKILMLSKVYGVLNEGVNFYELLEF